MKKIKKMAAEQVYLIRGASAANSPFFEKEEDCKLFLRLADRFLKDYLRINCFQNNRDGWVMLIVTRSSRDIKRAYYSRRSKSKKCQKKFEYKVVWQMLSDQIRILLSTYVKATNRKTGRSGGKVRCRYERFVFESEEEMESTRAAMERACYTQAQLMKRYRPSRKLHKMRKRLIFSSPFMSSVVSCLRGQVRLLGMLCMDFSEFMKDVARQLILPTYTHHFSP